MFFIFQSSNNQAFSNDIPYEFPKVESFRPNQNSIDLTLGNKITFDLIVSHAGGITSNQTRLWFFTNDNRFLTNTILSKIESKIVNTRTVALFQGTLEIPNYFLPNLYQFYAEPIEGFSATNSKVRPTTLNIFPENFNTFQGGEKSVVIRVAGQLNLDVKTFVGPSYNSEIYLTDNNPRNLFTAPPIFKVNEIFDPEKYFEKRVKDIKLKVESSTLSICSAKNDKLILVNTGICEFRVYSDKNIDYLETSIKLSATITGARIKPEINVPKIMDQNSSSMPKIFETKIATSNSGEIVSPTSLTPNVCLATGQYWINILSGGTCTLAYQTTETSSYLASDLYKVSFEVTRSPQTISFTLPNNANVSSKSLALTSTASSGAVVAYSTTSTGICSITGSTLNLLASGNCAVTATQAGTSTLSPASATATVMLTGAVVADKKSITCVKGKSIKKVSGTNPKCPKGFKLKK
jgi:hypothetical protein